MDADDRSSRIFANGVLFGGVLVRANRQRVRPATERAALAMLAKQTLEPAQFDVLYAPFEPLIPSALLFGVKLT